ncbi:MAG: glycoside hydrolase family 47 protein [Ignavibacteriae bacterium]|nr:glycoside hydrolase family 47 protein [Ignavibacteria bacterium]MBI3364546.1 glycoside hydrolase family 47 protein [Ignavibacteriota bacterium]
MRTLFRHFVLVVLLNAAWYMTAVSKQHAATADSVKEEFQHAWSSYKQYAWGHDALKPLSKQPHDWYGTSLYMTPVDAYDVMLLMGLTKEAAEAKQLILDSLSFNKDIEIQSFEITIRHLGGLLAAYQMDGNKRFLALAEDLGKRLLPVYNSHTGMPYRFVHLQTGMIRDSINNPAEIGTALLEFGTLSKLTGNSIYYEKAKSALVQLYNHRSKIGLVGTWINVETGEWVDSTSHIGGAIDSYYEYLLKAWLLFGDKECKAMWDESIKAIETYLADTTHGGLWYGQVDMNTGKRTGTTFGSLEAFFPAVLCLVGDTSRAAVLEESCLKMWNLYGIEPEEINYATMKVTAKQYHLRPEIIESAYYLYRSTGDPKYLRMGETFFNGIVKYCRADAGYASLRDVTTKEKDDAMQSFFFAETMKYLYLLFAPKETLPFEKVIFTTEAHPIWKTHKE